MRHALSCKAAHLQGKGRLSLKGGLGLARTVSEIQREHHFPWLTIGGSMKNNTPQTCRPSLTTLLCSRSICVGLLPRAEAHTGLQEPAAEC